MPRTALRATGGGGGEPTRRTRSDEVTYFVGFYEIAVGFDPEKFGADESSGWVDLSEEEIVLAQFACFVVHCNSQAGGARTDSAAYAESCPNAVRTWVFEGHGRRPGPSEAHTLREMLRCLHKSTKKDETRARRLPILREHLLVIRALLNLRGSQHDRTLWAFYLTCWQGVCRAGDLILPKRERREAWDPTREMHLGRLQGERLADGRRRLELSLKPTKVDPGREKQFCKTFLTDPDETALSAGSALVAMLANRPKALDKTVEPLFLDPDTGLELSYEVASGTLSELLRKAGYFELAKGKHSLRLGGAKSAAAIDNFRASIMGIWFTSPSQRHMWEMRDKIEATARKMAINIVGLEAAKPGAEDVQRA